jgi:deoxyadenosine/deoxycytidine kinase
MKLIVVEGNIGVGKTTLVKEIEHEFKIPAVYEDYAGNPFLPKFYKNQSDYSFLTEMAFMIDRYKKMADASQQNDFIISDYFFLKSDMFARVNLNPSEYCLFSQYFSELMNRMALPLLYIRLKRNVRDLIQNIHNRGRVYEKMIDHNYLARIEKAYEQCLENVSFPVLDVEITDSGTFNKEIKPELKNTIKKLLSET